jgi:glycyl-tRNA synthetase beta chain
MSFDFLLEIGTEEIPHSMIEDGLAQLAKMIEPSLLGATPRVDGTPRRLVVRASGVPALRLGSQDLVFGPPTSAGLGAVQGFAKKMGVSSDKLEIRSTPKGDYYSFIKKTEDYAAITLLSRDLPDCILAIQWPKSMRWTDQRDVDFIRPIRWVVALLGDEVIPFEVAGVTGGELSRGHRVLANSEFKVTYASFEDILKTNQVILSAADRRAKIESEARALGATIDPDLLETLTYITEYPAAIKGDFDPAYLELPAEVLTMVMRHHQKYFAVETKPGVLAPHFVAVMNVPSDPEGLVKRGNERVLKARFNDARFFWEVDQKKKLADRVEDLSHVTFQAKLGTYLEKTNRVVAIIKELGGGEDDWRAALLCKADLTTEMVKEFTDLQGIVGGLYAKAQGENEAVSQAIYEHYKPLSMEDSIPSTWQGCYLSVADKLDNLREFFRIGMIPTGSRDPFALRRAAQGIVKILVEKKIEFRFDTLGDAELRAFLIDRTKYYFREVRGFKYDEVNAALAGEFNYLFEIEECLLALSAIRPTENFEPVAAGFTRIKNILRQANFAPTATVNPALIEAGPELDLYEEFERLAALLPMLDYRGTLEEFASLRPKIDNFFDKIMVNVPDEKTRANRLTLLHNLLAKFSTIADFSEIVTSGDQK